MPAQFLSPLTIARNFCPTYHIILLNSAFAHGFHINVFFCFALLQILCSFLSVVFVLFFYLVTGIVSDVVYSFLYKFDCLYAWESRILTMITVCKYIWPTNVDTIRSSLIAGPQQRLRDTHRS